jgi:hypothetical protein
MAEWLILIFVVPAVIIPVVLLLGFAGCDQVFGLERIDVLPPIISSAEGLSASIIRLTWSYTVGPPATEFEFERTRVLDLQDRQTFKAPSSPFDDNNAGQGLNEHEAYIYRVRAIGSDGEEGEWSGQVIGTTHLFETTFAWTTQEETLVVDDAPWDGYCIVQRIEAARLSSGGTKVKLTLRASSVNEASIEQIFISKPDPLGNNLYDSADDLTAVISTRVVIPANNLVTLPAINYNLDQSQPLLIVFAFSAPPQISGVKRIELDQVPADQASAFYKLDAAEAPKPNRASDFVPLATIILVEKIEVG